MDELLQLEKRLRRAIGQKRAVLAAAGITAWLSTGLGLVLLLSSLAALFVLPVAIKLALLAGSLGLLGYAVHKYSVVPLRLEKGLIPAALQIEKNHPELKGRLVAALQFRHLNLDRTNFSKALIELTGLQAAELAGRIDFTEIVSGYPLYRKLRGGLLVTALAVALGLLIPGFFSTAIDVYSQPTTLVAPPPGFSLTVVPGNVERVKYSDIELGGVLVGRGLPAEVSVHYRFVDGRWQNEKLALDRNGRPVVTLRDSLPFAITLKQVRRSLDYYVTAGDIQSQPYRIEVVDRPRVTSLKVTIDYPPYTRLESLHLDENTGSFAALVGSRVSLEIGANRDIAQGELVIDDSLHQTMTCAGPRATSGFTLSKDFTYYVLVHDRQGEQNPDPIAYTVTAVPDEYPVIDVLFPGFDLNLDESMLIPFKLHITDDYGFSSLVLKYQIVSGGRKGADNVAVINFPARLQIDGEVTFNWDMEGFDLLPSDYVLYHFELADNDKVSGPKVTATRVYAARLPSIDEIVKDAQTDQDSRLTESERILQEQKEMTQKLDQMVREMKTNQKMDWQSKKEMENLAAQQQKTVDRLEEMAREMQASLQKMDKNNLVSEQILQKMMELQKLFSEIATPQMKEALKKLQDALKEMSEEDLKKALEEAQLTQEEMLKRLERTIELLKRLQIQQTMSAMLKMAEEMLLEQNRVNVETEEAPVRDGFGRQAQREQQLQTQMAALKDEAGRLQKMLSTSPYSDSEKHKRFGQAVEENQAAADMSQMAVALNESRQAPALKSGQASSSKLESLVDEMRTIISELSDREGEELANQIRKTINDANYLSQKQEDIYTQGGRGDPPPNALSQLAAEQQVLREAVGGLLQRANDLAKRSPFLGAEVMSYLNQSQQEMNGACNSLSDRRGRSAQTQQRDAMYNLNRASTRLLDGLDEQKQCNKGGSCNKNSQKLQSLCQKQNQINTETKGACSKPGESLSPSQREALRKLASEQNAVRKSIQELQAEFGDRREILGRLDALGDEARRIEEMLDQGQAGQELFDRQLKVYSRMLDLQKSLTRRDYAEERKATTADDILRASPGPLEGTDSRLNETLQDRLQRSLQEGYPRQYEQQIKAYFKALSNFNQNGTGHE